MKLLLGFDDECKFKSALNLLNRLRFDGPEWHFAHIVSPLDPSPSWEPSTGSDAAARLKDSLHDYDGLASTVEEVTTAFSGTVHLAQGAPAAFLMKIAEDIRADIVGIGSSGHGPLGSMLFGSVARALAVGSNCSFLVGRGVVANSGHLRVVFATDYSDYARRALTEFLRFRPAGVGEVILTTAHEMLEPSELLQYLELVEEGSQAGRTLREELEHLGAQAVEECKRYGIDATAELRDGPVGSAVDASVKEHRADLVVFGAQGHGFLERLVIGSVALQQVITRRESTLVMRPRLH